MKFTIAAVVAFATFAAASPLLAEKEKEKPEAPEMPKCAAPCLESAVAKKTKCVLEDLDCVCAHQKEIIAEASGCIVDKCGLSAALNKVKPAGEAKCKGRKTTHDDEKPKDGKPKDEKPKDEKPKDEKPKDEKPKDEKPKDEKPKEAN
ncbi:hypothetical protein NLG97_g8083 [Lecanicillium saksenae]|uniref:Uncharacterized protein n=1 Tax=Lecanicillium saksenae TaxID=468837 RepID=A0ACC1QLN5_9HYPO|nr:hypothetical protein NLG97_g8083 [Lecanicillium saksenae]